MKSRHEEFGEPIVMKPETQFDMSRNAQTTSKTSYQKVVFKTTNEIQKPDRKLPGRPIDQCRREGPSLNVNGATKKD